MSTQAQIDANRANANNATDRKTDEGKARSAANARRQNAKNKRSQSIFEN
jgi:hypothetical protein